MSQQQPIASAHTERASNTPFKLVPRPFASGESNPSINLRLPNVVQAKPLSTIVESSTPEGSQRRSQQGRSGVPVETVNGQTARPVIMVTEPATPAMNTERAGPVDRRTSTRQNQGNFRHEQSRYPAGDIVRPSMQHTNTSESMRREEASYYAEEEEQDQGSYYGQTAAQQSRALGQTKQSLARSRRYSPRRASPPPPLTVQPLLRSGSRSPPLSERLTVFHKPISVAPGQPSNNPPAETLSTRDADSICDDLVRRVKIAQLGKMYDKAVEADRRGLVDDGLYDMVLDFFYRFLPMVFANGESDPIIINRRQILDHHRVWQIFGPRGVGISRKDRGKNRPHPWYTRPKDKKMSLKDVVGEVVDSIPRVHIVPGPAKRKKDESQGQR
ncbi:hypothetical protein IFR04_012306 [Cadophora malorum]|uniref:Uncharacterized protein n=1 Tax=Cadophora malorum TaxID=108018 RepID=A0A8H7T985_9HELO|nr:hypothetical protein IFR04_012306 [Cadophora malorum]